MPHLGELAALVYERDKVAEFSTRYDQDADPPTLAYLGKAYPGASDAASVWQIQKLTFGMDGDVVITWAGGNAGFSNVWNDRASLSYS